LGIKKNVFDKWADILLNHALKGIVAADVVMIKGESAAWPLISALQEKIYKAGALADVFLVPPDNERGRAWGATAARLGKPPRFKRLPQWQKHRYAEFTKYIEILGMEAPALVRNADGPLMNRIMRLDDELVRIRREKPWVITMFPTEAFARIEGMPFPAYRKLLLKGSTMAPGVLLKKAERLAKLLRKTKTIRVITRDPKAARPYELRVSLAKSIILKDGGTISANIPLGEVFTSPDSSSVEGEIFLDMPISTRGDVIRGVYLKFIAGKAVSFRAEKGARGLARIIGTDSGSKRLGEVAFGINPGLTTPLMHPLFCEKLAGTMHFALGNCLPEGLVGAPASRKDSARFRALVKSGVANVSVQHVDLVVSFRKGGAGKAVFLDDRQLRLRNGNWAGFYPGKGSSL
jgi:aminopeptidase